MACVPSLSGALFIRSPQSIIAYTINKFLSTPADAIPIVGDTIISVRSLISQYNDDVDTLQANIRTSLQNCFDRIFADERKITVNCGYEMSENGTATFTITILYTADNDELKQLGTSIKLGSDGELIIPETRLDY